MATIINLSAPIRGAWEGRGFGRRYIWQYECSNGHTVRISCGAWRGKTPETGRGAITCPQCTTTCKGCGTEFRMSYGHTKAVSAEFCSILCETRHDSIDRAAALLADATKGA